MKKALKILEWIIKENDISFISKNNLNEAIKELEELNNRSCNNCNHFVIHKGEYGICKMGFNNRKFDYLHNSYCCNTYERLNHSNN